MGTVISNLKAKFGIDTSDFKSGLKDGEKAVDDFKGAAGGMLDEFASMFGVNMSGVNSAIGTATKSLNMVQQSFMGAARGGNILAISLKLLKVALISIGLGAIVVVLGSIIAYFSKTGAGADKFAKILLQVKSVVNNVIDRLAVFGKGLWQILTGKFAKGWETMTSAFKGMGEEIKEDWRAAGQLADAEDALEDREIALINSLSERKTKISELRQLAKEELEDNHKNLDLLKQARTLIKSVYGDEISLEKERLRIMKEKLAIQSSDPTDEQRREIAVQEAKINDLYHSQADELKGLTREMNTVVTAVKKMENQARSFANLKMPQFFNQKSMDALKETLSHLQHTFIQTKEIASSLFLVMEQVGVDAAKAINEAFTNGAEGLGEFLGALATGQTGIGGFGRLVAGTFADLAINVGKIAIGAGMAILGVKEALMTLNPYVAIAAGIALVAIGSAIKGSLAKVASGSGTSGSSFSASGGSLTFDTRSPQASTINITGKLIAEGKDLVYVFKQENNRINAAT